MSMTRPATRSTRRWWAPVVEIGVALLVVFVAKGALAEPFYVPSGSMEPTLMIGDALLATKFPYGYSTASVPLNISLPSSSRVLGTLPQRGDVVVFRWPGDRSQVWVKRVVGLPGDHVQMRDGELFINGEPCTLRPDGTGRAENEDGSDAKADRYVETLPGGRSHPIFKTHKYDILDNTPDVVVPAGHVFVLGDNRDNSADSRVTVSDGGVGLLPVDNLVGRVEGIVGSWDLGLSSQSVWTWPSGLRLARTFMRVH